MSSQCAHCECRLDVNRPAHDSGCHGDIRSYDRCEECDDRCLRADLVNGCCENCAPVLEEAS